MRGFEFDGRVVDSRSSRRHRLEATNAAMSEILPTGDALAAAVCSRTFVKTCEFWAELPSTNDRAALLANAEPARLPLLIWAERQTAGRGRGCHRWWSAAGALTVSLLLEGRDCVARFPAAADEAGIAAANGLDRRMFPGQCNSDPAAALAARRSGLVALAAALAVIDAVRPLIDVEVGLHWPNDVFALGRKLSGVLIEVLPNGRHIVGVGINANNPSTAAPEGLSRKLISLAELRSEPVDRVALAIDLCERLRRWLERLREDAHAVAAAADGACLQRGWTLTIRDGRDEFTGRCEGIDRWGRLCLSVPPAGVRCFASGTLIHDDN